MRCVKLIIVVIILFLQPIFANNIKLFGVVKNASSAKVTIQSSELKDILIGAIVYVYYETSSGLKMKIGEGKIYKKDKNFVYAKA